MGSLRANLITRFHVPDIRYCWLKEDLVNDWHDGSDSLLPQLWVSSIVGIKVESQTSLSLQISLNFSISVFHLLTIVVFGRPLFDR